MRTSHQSLCMVLDNLESFCTAGFEGTSKSNIELNCLPILVSFCCKIREGEDISGIRQEAVCKKVIRSMFELNGGYTT